MDHVPVDVKSPLEADDVRTCHASDVEHHPAVIDVMSIVAHASHPLAALQLLLVFEVVLLPSNVPALADE